MTVYNRYKKLQESGSMSKWQIFVNPTFFGYRALDVMAYVQPESGKADMIRKIRLIQGVFVMLNFYGKALKIIMVYDSEESRSRAVELISRITNAERITSSRMVTPVSKTERITETDVAIIRALSDDARKSPVLLAKELGLSTRTVRNRVEKLRRENTIFTLPNLNLGGIPGSIAVYLSVHVQQQGSKRFGRP
jgi:DNA-binding Lrp family transcriptional regulator